MQYIYEKKKLSCCRETARCFVRVPSLKFVGLAVRKIWRTMCVSINRSGDLDLWPFDLETGEPVAPKVGNCHSEFMHARPLNISPSHWRSLKIIETGTIWKLGCSIFGKEGDRTRILVPFPYSLSQSAFISSHNLCVFTNSTGIGGWVSLTLMTKHYSSLF